MAIANAKIRTEDVVEILDGKILATRSHSSLFVAIRENYDSILTKISLQILTPGEKAAFDNTLTVPSASNPVVLKNDLQTYIPQVDLGEVKDSVATFALLPIVGNTTGDLRAVIADGIIYRWNGLIWSSFIHTGTLDHTGLTAATMNNDSNYQHLTLAEKSSLLANNHTHSNLAILNQIVNPGSGQIITAAERLRLPTSDEKNALLGTSGVPSITNRYVTNQDSRLNTTRNPYVTVGPPGSLATFSGVDAVPFEDALVAIDVGSATAVKAIEVLPGAFSLGGAILTWDTSSSALLIEAFTPGTVILSFQTFQAGLQALLPGTGPVTIRGFIFELNNLGTSGVLSERPNTLIEDCVFKPGPTISINQIGVILNGANSVVRRCSFLNQLQVGIEIRAANCRVEECTFSLTNPQRAGIHIKVGGDNAIIDHNTFVGAKLKVDPLVKYAQVSNNFWNQTSSALTCIIGVGSPAVISVVNNFSDLNLITFTTTGVLPTGLVSGRKYYVRNRTATTFNISLTTAGSLINATIAGSGIHTVMGAEFVHDGGASTRYLENQPEDFNQPFVGKIRTIGPTDSYADYRGVTEIPFLLALDDPNVSELEILPGTYTFATSVTIPSGIKIRGVTQGDGAVFIVGNAGITLFKLNGDTGLEDLQLSGSNAPLVLGQSLLTKIRLERCTFNLTAQVAATDYGVFLSSIFDSKILHCTFNGVRGLRLDTSTRSKVMHNKFNCSSANLLTQLSCTNDHIKDNFFITTVTPAISGADLIIEGNHFLGVLPTKLNTTGSVWQSNYPAPEANNVEGVDNIEVSLDSYLEPTVGAVVRSEISSAGALSYGLAATASAATLPIKLSARLNTAASFTVDVFWTSTLTSGDTVWEVTPVFRDAVTGILGSSSSQQQVSSRTGLSSLEEDAITFTFTTLAYGGSVNPTHMSLVVSRLGGHPADTLTANAYLLDVKVTLPRD